VISPFFLFGRIEMLNTHTPANGRFQRRFHDYVNLVVQSDFQDRLVLLMLSMISFLPIATLYHI